MMVFGLLAVRMRVFQEPLRKRKLLIAVIVYGAVAGICSTLIGNLWHPQFASLRLGMGLRTLVFTVFDERFQGLAYAAGLLLWIARQGTSQNFISLLAAPGRLSLTMSCRCPFSKLFCVKYTAHPAKSMECFDRSPLSIPAPGLVQPLVDGALPLRTTGVAVAFHHARQMGATYSRASTGGRCVACRRKVKFAWGM
jgi:hypothetical protein